MAPGGQDSWKLVLVEKRLPDADPDEIEAHAKTLGEQVSRALNLKKNYPEEPVPSGTYGGWLVSRGLICNCKHPSYGKNYHLTSDVGRLPIAQSHGRWSVYVWYQKFVVPAMRADGWPIEG